MLEQLFADPQARRLYLTTKAIMLVVLAALTWPLSLVIGPVAWWGLAAVAVVLGLLALPVLLMGRSATEGESEAAGDDVAADGEDERDPSEPVHLPIEDHLDLHPFAPDEIPDVVRSYLDEAYDAGFDEVRLIHGRGIGVQRERVRKVLAGDPRVVSYHDAPPTRGGWGATVAKLRSDPEPERS